MIDVAHTVVYAVGDVHGCLDQLLALEDLIRRDGARYEAPKLIVMLGDYIDRGPGSRQVLAHLSSRTDGDFARICLCGNHEDGMLRFLNDPAGNRDWLMFGGERTLSAYNVDAQRLLRTPPRRRDAARRILQDAIPPEHVAFLRQLPAAAHGNGFIFAHAGIRPGIALDQQTDHDLLWIRQPFLDEGPRLPLVVVHGHTPVTAPVVASGRIGVDTGCYMTGRLTAVRLLAGTASFLSTR